MFGVVRGTGGVFRPCGRLVMEGEVGGVFRDTGHGPFRALIVSNLKWGGPCCGHYVFPAGRYQNHKKQRKHLAEYIMAELLHLLNILLT